MRLTFDGAQLGLGRRMSLKVLIKALQHPWRRKLLQSLQRLQPYRLKGPQELNRNTCILANLGWFRGGMHTYIYMYTHIYIHIHTVSRYHTGSPNETLKSEVMRVAQGLEELLVRLYFQLLSELNAAVNGSLHLISANGWYLTSNLKLEPMTLNSELRRCYTYESQSGTALGLSALVSSAEKLPL